MDITEELRKQLGELPKNLTLETLNEAVQKYDFFFTPDEYAILRETGFDLVLRLFQNCGKLELTPQGVMSIDSIYQAFFPLFVQLSNEGNIERIVKVIPIFQKALVLLCIKADESVEMSIQEKLMVLKLGLNSLEKFTTAEGLNVMEVFPEVYPLAVRLIAKYERLLEEEMKKASTPLPIQFVKVTMDPNTPWIAKEGLSNVFYWKSAGIASSPILDFLFINHLPNTVVLIDISLKAESVSPGLSGVGEPSPGYVTQVQGPKFIIEPKKEFQTPINFSDIELLSNRACKISCALSRRAPDTKEVIITEEPYALNFQFTFSNGDIIQIPTIFLNCENKNGPAVYRCS
jgi:hypothetical protein